MRQIATMTACFAVLFAVGCGQQDVAPEPPVTKDVKDLLPARPPTVAKRKDLLAAKSPPAVAAAELSIDWDKTHQTIVGFGGTMGWIHPHEKHRETIFDLLFTDLGASVLRIRALGAETGDEGCAEPKNDNDDPTVFNWDGFHFKITEARNAVIIKAAEKRGVKTVIATAWSPPGWMKDTGLRAGGGSLQKKHLADYAEHWAAYVIAMKRDFDIDIRYLSIQNEPDIEYYYPTCGIDPGPYAVCLQAVRGRLQKENRKTRVLGPDCCRIYHIKDYVDKLEATNVNPGEPILTHLYDLSIPYEAVHRDAERWRAARQYADRLRRPLWLMETANYLSNTDPGSFTEALIWARKVHHALVDGNCEVVCYWSLYFDKLGEALIYAEKSDVEAYKITPKYHVSKHWYRYVRPGMQRCAASSPQADLLVTAFRGRRQRVVVVVNIGKEDRRIRVPLARAAVRRTAAGVDWWKVSTAAGVVNLPARSVTSFVGE